MKSLINWHIFDWSYEALFFMLCSLAKLKLTMNFNAISKNVKILQIRPVEPKLWKIREMTVMKIRVSSSLSGFLKLNQECMCLQHQQIDIIFQFPCRIGKFEMFKICQFFIINEDAEIPWDEFLQHYILRT